MKWHFCLKGIWAGIWTICLDDCPLCNRHWPSFCSYNLPLSFNYSTLADSMIGNMFTLWNAGHIVLVHWGTTHRSCKQLLTVIESSKGTVIISLFVEWFCSWSTRSVFYSNYLTLSFSAQNLFNILRLVSCISLTIDIWVILKLGTWS